MDWWMAVVWDTVTTVAAAWICIVRALLGWHAVWSSFVRVHATIWCLLLLLWEATVWIGHRQSATPVLVLVSAASVSLMSDVAVTTVRFRAEGLFLIVALPALPIAALLWTLLQMMLLFFIEVARAFVILLWRQLASLGTTRDVSLMILRSITTTPYLLLLLHLMINIFISLCLFWLVYALFAREHLNLMTLLAHWEDVVDALARRDLSRHLGDHLLQLIYLAVALLPLALLLLLLCDLCYLLFELHDETIFGFHVSSEGIKLLLRLQIDSLQLIERLFLLIKPLFVFIIVIHDLLEVRLNRFELFFFFEHVWDKISAVLLHIVMLSLDLHDGLTSLLNLLLKLRNDLLCAPQLFFRLAQFSVLLLIVCL